MGFTVKQARQYAGFTQREMAEKLGISRDTYRKIEQSPEDATVATAKRISEGRRHSHRPNFFRQCIYLK